MEDKALDLVARKSTRILNFIDISSFVFYWCLDGTESYYNLVVLERASAVFSV